MRGMGVGNAGQSWILHGISIEQEVHMGTTLLAAVPTGPCVCAPSVARNEQPLRPVCDSAPTEHAVAPMLC